MKLLKNDQRAFLTVRHLTDQLPKLDAIKNNKMIQSVRDYLKNVKAQIDKLDAQMEKQMAGSVQIESIKAL